MRCAITTSLTKEKLTAAVPHRYRLLLPPLSQPLYTLLKFRSDRTDVVISSVVRAALARVSSDETLVAVGGAFTLEGLALLNLRRAIVLQLSEFGWSDEQYIRIHSGHRKS